MTMTKRRRAEADARRAAKKARLAVLHAEQVKARAADRAKHAADWEWRRKNRKAA